MGHSDSLSKAPNNKDQYLNFLCSDVLRWPPMKNSQQLRSYLFYEFNFWKLLNMQNLKTLVLFRPLTYLSFFSLNPAEYDRHLAAAVSAGKTMATAYMDPNLNNAFLAGAKSRLSTGGSDRTMAGSMDRVLKVFHYFETNTEHSFWSSNIRYGDATDVRVRNAFAC